MTISIRIYKHGEVGMWEAIGPFVASREVHKELGGPLYSDEQTTWFVAYSNKAAIGFASMREAKSATHYDYDYVAPSERSKGVYTRLAAARDEAAKKIGKPLETLVCAPRWKHYRQAGWKKLSERGQWLRLGKEIP